MSDQPDSSLKCDKCSNPVEQRDDYCQNCGAVFKEGLFCIHHRSRAADGVCVICKRAFCDKCGGDEMNVFFCNHHDHYEFHEGMARVFGHTDNLQVQYALRCLQQAGFHPFLFSRRFNPGAGIARWIPLRVYGRNSIAELKVLVPFSEVLESEETLKSLSLYSL